MTEQLYVRDVMVELTQAIRDTQTLIAARQRMQGDMRVKSLIVVDENNHPLGAIRYNDMSQAEAQGTVADFLVSNIPTVSPDDALESVTGIMSEYDVDRLAVVDSSGAIVGELPREALTLSETTGTASGIPLDDLVDRDTPVYQVTPDMAVVGRNGHKIGKVREVLSDAATGALTHVIVHTGLIFDHNKSVPADLVEGVSGDEVMLKVEKSEIDALPDLEEIS